MIIDFNWFNSQEVKNVISMVMKILDIIRIVIPIALIALTTFDIVKKVINPEDKDGQKKIMIRAIAALVVFLSPIFVNFVLSFMGIDTKELGGIGSNVQSKDITPTYTIAPKPVEISSISLFGCPTSLKIGEKAELKTNIPSNYKGAIRWEQNDHFFDIRPSSDKKSATIELINDSNETYTTITVSAGSVQHTCTIRVDASFSITNCPSYTNVYKPGEKLKLITSVSTKYNGKLLWEHTNGVFKMTPNDDDNSITLEVVDNPSTTVSTVTAYKNGKKASCLIYVERPKLSSVSITNCPDRSVKLSPGEEFVLSTDIPSDFKGDIEWIPDSFTNNFIITPSADGRSATLKVVNQPASSWSTTTVLAGGKANACLINVLKD